MVQELRGARAEHAVRVVKEQALVSILLIRSARLIKIGLVARAVNLMAHAKVVIIKRPKSHPIQRRVKLCLHQWYLENLMLH
jgi:hypothetical protein